MTAQILQTLSPLLPPISSAHTCRLAHDRSNTASTLRREVSQKWADVSIEPQSLRGTDADSTSQPTNPANQEAFWTALVNSVPHGLMVIARNLQPVYINQKANDLCQGLLPIEQRSSGLPVVVLEACHRLFKAGESEMEPTVMECLNAERQTIRIYASWLMPSPGGDRVARNQAYVIVRLENCYETLQEELRIERKKYDLTDREAEIWLLLRQECTYQMIAKMLQISLNTVKTHVKNLYAKKRSFQGQEKIVVF